MNELSQNVSYKRTKRACYLTCFSTAAASNIAPLLFLTFRETYGISFSRLGFLVVLNFGTQLLLDLLFSFFSHRFNIPLSLRLTPAVMCLGLGIFALSPRLFPQYAYFGIAAGTVIYSAGNGLAEVLISPTVAAIPSIDPDRDMSRLHSCYAWGVVATVAISTGFFLLFGTENWVFLIGVLMILPLSATVLLALSKTPPMETAEKTAGAVNVFRNPTVIYYILCIFLGGASECTMSQWCSGYLETAFGIDKAIGDVFGLALFGVAMGIGRSLYAKRGKNIHRTLFIGAAGATVCYTVAAFSPLPILGLAACAMTGYFTAMLWPGSLIAVTEQVPGSVTLFAMMAMGGDIGAALCPQIVGWVADAVLVSPTFQNIAPAWNLTPDQLAMKSGLAVAILFPLSEALLLIGRRRGRP